MFIQRDTYYCLVSKCTTERSSRAAPHQKKMFATTVQNGKKLKTGPIELQEHRGFLLLQLARFPIKEQRVERTTCSDQLHLQDFVE